MAWDATGRPAWDATHDQGGREWQQLQQSHHMERGPRHPAEQTRARSEVPPTGRVGVSQRKKPCQACIAPLTGPRDERIESSL